MRYCKTPIFKKTNPPVGVYFRNVFVDDRFRRAKRRQLLNRVRERAADVRLYTPFTARREPFERTVVFENFMEHKITKYF